jgi:hypothetical protein
MDGVFTAIKRATLPKRKYQLDSQPEKARDHYYHDYDADDVEDVHCHAPGELVVTLVRDDSTMLGAPKSSAFALRTS